MRYHGITKFNKTAMILTVAILLIVPLIGIVFIFLQGKPCCNSSFSTTYYDLGTGKIFLADYNEIPPIDTGSGTQPDGSFNGVRIHVWTCDLCIPQQNMAGMIPAEIEAIEGKSMFVAYLVKYDEAGRQQIETIQELNTERKEGYVPITGIMIRELDGKWVDGISVEGDALMKKALGPKCEGGTYPRPCLD